MRAGRRKVKNPLTARRILAAAEEHFADQGMAGARTEEIASAAHANKAMLYYYFGDKRRLHRAVMENLLRQLRNAAFAPLAAKTSSRDRLIGWVNGYFDFFATHPNYPRLVQREVMDTAPKFEWIVREYFRPFHKRLRSLME
jgi:AcrR family transcriptional regulator